jgi:hypothetical protein
LEKEQAHGLHSFNGRDLLAELEELRERVAGVESDRATENMTLSWSVMGISDALVDLSMFPIREMPEHLKSAQDVLTVAGLVLEHLREEHASDASSWVLNLARPMPP